MSATKGVGAAMISAAASSIRSRERLAIATWAPSRAREAAIARPSPRLAPITRAVRLPSPKSTLLPLKCAERAPVAQWSTLL